MSGQEVIRDWATWPWNRCPARTERWERCDRRKRHPGDHALEHGLDIPQWSTRWTSWTADETRDAQSGVEAVLREAVLRVNREHEDVPWGCSCGAKFGDSIDRRWHLINQTAAALAPLLAAERAKAWDEGEEALRTFLHGGSVPSNPYRADREQP